MKFYQPALISSLFLSLAYNATAGTLGIAPSMGFYINAGLGAVFSNTTTSYTSNSNSVLYAPTAIGTSLFTLPDVNWHNKFKNGYGINLAIGKYFNLNWHGDLEFLYQDIQRDTYGTYNWLEQNSTTGATYSQQANNLISKITTRANIYSFMTNASYDLINFGKIQPFLGAGLGLSWLKSGSTQTNNSINIDDPNTPLIETAPAMQNSPSLYGTAFAWQFKAGINYAVSNTATAILQYRLFQTTDFKAGQSTIITNPGMAGQTEFYVGQHDIEGSLTHAVELNLRFDV
ncbi:MAG: outer membrane beta-barrel protein [Legionella sp.]|nr:outer membrane beta-barrel protein [Legionella sp.]